MAEEHISTEVPIESGAENRIKELSNKVKLASEERDESKRLKDETDMKLVELQKERDFYSQFSDVISTHPAARDHKDDILAKVKIGYTVEDATVSVLAKAGKYAPARVASETPAGGSANVAPPQGGKKQIKEMTQNEKREALIAAETRGDISMS